MAPLQNRVLPDGRLVAVPDRGTMMGNRGGPFHRDDQTLRQRHWRSNQWICCVLAFKGRRRAVMQPKQYTELFFLDEATALAAGHRPCFECRRKAAEDFASRWNNLHGRPGRARAGAMDQVLHAERQTLSGDKRIYRALIDTLPDNAFVVLEGSATRLAASTIQRWGLTGYELAVARPHGITVDVLTPPAVISVLAAGYRPELHTTATS
jgi:hypothetical protein